MASDTLRGTVERITCHNEETGYTVAQLMPDGQGYTVPVIGAMLGVNVGESVLLAGAWRTWRFSAVICCLVSRNSRSADSTMSSAHSARLERSRRRSQAACEHDKRRGGASVPARPHIDNHTDHERGDRGGFAPTTDRAFRTRASPASALRARP